MSARLSYIYNQFMRSSQLTDPTALFAFVAKITEEERLEAEAKSRYYGFAFDRCEPAAVPAPTRAEPLAQSADAVASEPRFRWERLPSAKPKRAVFLVIRARTRPEEPDNVSTTSDDNASSGGAPENNGEETPVLAGKRHSRGHREQAKHGGCGDNRRRKLE